MTLQLLLAVTLAVLIAFVIWTYIRQKQLKQRAYIMSEAIRNHDFTFQLPTHHLLFGERAMQTTLNNLSDVIRQQINTNEVESWEKLTRVLTHEIMNSTTPILSISQALLNRPEICNGPLEESMQTIHSTACHLAKFVGNWRRFSLSTQTKPQNMVLAELLQEVTGMYPQIEWNNTVKKDLIIYADPLILKSVIINLVKNAIEADATKMGFDTQSKTSHLYLYVSNNGHPIPASIQKSIFVPFFTTKNEGHGIGLSISRRMLVAQGHFLELSDQAISPYSTTFLIIFAIRS